MLNCVLYTVESKNKQKKLLFPFFPLFKKKFFFSSTVDWKLIWKPHCRCLVVYLYSESSFLYLAERSIVTKCVSLKKWMKEVYDWKDTLKYSRKRLCVLLGSSHSLIRTLIHHWLAVWPQAGGFVSLRLTFLSS